MPQQFDPSKPFTPVEGFDPSKPFEPATVSAVSPTETSSYLSGALKGAKEGVEGGASGFVKGLADSPRAFAEGLAHLLTTNPATSVKEVVEAIKRLPDAIQQAGNDPEAWGRAVGNQTGQTMISMAAPAAVKAGVPVVGQGATLAGQGLEALGDSAAMRRIGTFGAAGAAMHGDLGTAAIAAAAPTAMGVGGRALQAVGKAMSGAKPLTAAETAAEAAIARLSSAEPIKAADYFKMLSQVPAEQRGAVFAARRAAIEAEQAAPAAAAPSAQQTAPAPAPAPQATAPVQPPPAAPVAQPAPASPAEAPVVPAAAKTVVQWTPESVMTYTKLIRAGKTPTAALETIAAAQKLNAAANALTPLQRLQQELLQGGAAEAEFARQYAARKGQP